MQLCSRTRFHHLNSSLLNSDGALDVGAIIKGANIFTDGPVASFMNASEQAEAKFHLNLDGATIAYRLRHVLEGLCPSRPFQASYEKCNDTENSSFYAVVVEHSIDYIMCALEVT